MRDLFIEQNDNLLFYPEKYYCQAQVGRGIGWLKHSLYRQDAGETKLWDQKRESLFIMEMLSLVIRNGQPNVGGHIGINL